MKMKDVKTMTSKAYIVANEQQEREVLEKLEREGMTWIGGGKPTEFIPIRLRISDALFPYALLDKGRVSWKFLPQLEDEEIVFDGRKEEQMSEKYVVSQEFMNELEDWKDTLDSNDYEYKPLVGWVNLKNLPETVNAWYGDEVPDDENNNRLIAIIRWVNGEDVFEVEKPKKWVVRSKATDNDGDYRYVSLFDSCFGITYADSGKDKSEYATHFDTKEEAESWANAHQEVVEVEI